MKLLAYSGALRSPLQIHNQALVLCLATSQRCLHTTSPRCRDAKPVTKPWGSHTTHNLDAKVAARGRVNSVSSGHDPKARLRQSLQKSKGRHATFRNAVLSYFQKVLSDMSTSEFSVVGVGKDEMDRQAVLFMDALDKAFDLAEQNVTRRDKNPLFFNLREAFINKDVKGLVNEIRYAFQSFLVRFRFTKGIETSQQKLLDFRFPQDWMPATRQVQRTIHIHVGPTNSGKTYHALKALENSKRGIYAGPLRLLATEVYQRLQAKGHPCALITGEEVRVPEGTDRYYASCTVEMVPLNTRVDVAVIDEIQMIADPDRGNAWTMALLGVQAKEVHVCGEERTVSLLESLCASMGDKCVIHKYERLSPLQTAETAIDNDYNKLEKGDAIVSFSRLSLHALKRNIERATGRRVAIIYGGLPPEVRVAQAALFNDPNNDYDFIVASDAIGMGLNLEIRRVIFEAVSKHDGTQRRLLNYPEVKQIGGRAGRYRTAARPDENNTDPAAQSMGFVTTMDYDDLRHVEKAFTKTVPPIEHAYLNPPTGIVERFASYYPPNTPLSFILTRIRESAVLGPKFKMSYKTEILEIADHLQDIPLTTQDRLTLCFVPVNTRNPQGIKVLRALAKIISESGSGTLLDIKEIPIENVEIDLTNTMVHGQDYLAKLETLHDAINMYIWLSYRYSGMFRDQTLAFHVRSLAGQRLIELLEKLNFTDKQLEDRRRRQRTKAFSHQMTKQAMDSYSDQDGAEGEEGETTDLEAVELSADYTVEQQPVDLTSAGEPATHGAQAS